MTRSTPARTVLFTPGPCMVPPAVSAAATATDYFHRDPRFAAMARRVCDDLVAIGGGDARHDCVPMGCSGSGAIEAALAWHGGPLLVLLTGVYASRLAEMARYIGLDPEGFDWCEDDPYERLAERLSRDPVPRTIAVVHHETAAGTLVDVERIATLAARFGARLVVDAVASFGGHETRFCGEGFGAVVITPNKCLESLPGMAFVLAPRDLLRHEARCRASAYLDLAAQYRRMTQSGEPRFTLPVHTVAALEVALKLLRRETLAGRAARYRGMRAYLLERMVGVGLEPSNPPDAIRASFIQMFNAPARNVFERWRADLSAMGIVIYTDTATVDAGKFYLSVAGDIGKAEIDLLADSLGPMVAAWRKTLV